MYLAGKRERHLAYKLSQCQVQYTASEMRMQEERGIIRLYNSGNGISKMETKQKKKRREIEAERQMTAE